MSDPPEPKLLRSGLPARVPLRRGQLVADITVTRRLRWPVQQRAHFMLPLSARYAALLLLAACGFACGSGEVRAGDASARDTGGPVPRVPCENYGNAGCVQDFDLSTCPATTTTGCYCDSEPEGGIMAVCVEGGLPPKFPGVLLCCHYQRLHE